MNLGMLTLSDAGVWRLNLTNSGDRQVLLGVAKVYVLVEGLTCKDLGGIFESKTRCESESICSQMLSLGATGSVKVKVYLGVMGHVVAVDGDLDGVAHEEEHHNGHQSEHPLL